MKIEEQWKSHLLTSDLSKAFDIHVKSHAIVYATVCTVAYTGKVMFY